MFDTCLPANAKNALAILGKSKFLKKAYLAGGTACALQLGHRISVDFDFFSNEQFDTEEVIHKLQQIGTFKLEQKSWQTILGQFNKVKFSYFYYQYPLIRSTKDYLGINLASLEDIIAMKIAAIADRGSKKDFVDLFFLHHQGFFLSQMLSFYDQKYQKLKANQFHILKSLTYFDDAEKSGKLQMLQEVSWKKVKKFWITQVKEYVPKWS